MFFLPRRGCRIQPRVSTLGNIQEKRFALKGREITWAKGVRLDRFTGDDITDNASVPIEWLPQKDSHLHLRSSELRVLLKLNDTAIKLEPSLGTAPRSSRYESGVLL